MTIRSDLTVHELVRQRPETLPMLAAAGIDTCCGGDESLERAAAGIGLEWTELRSRLEAVTGSSPEDSPTPPCGCGCKHG